MGHPFETIRRTVLLKLLPGVVDKIDAAALAAGKSRVDWLRKAVLERLNRDEVERSKTDKMKES
ncbi:MULTISPECIES: hypothetical protein [unclassified Mesorhizobium]|uniref:hypothetical protein n=1 Tax=unclassified Mesorhizobium TaxID=325217 RepID=UPI00333B6386